MSRTSTLPKNAMLAAPVATEPISATGIARRPAERRVGKYYTLAELGRGGTARVYLAVARGAGGVSKLVVLKALLPEFAEESGAVASFIDEARLAAQLNHPNVVQTYEVGVEAGQSVIVMEYLEGQSLSRITRFCEAANRRLPDAMHFKILIELLAGLHYAHELKSYEGVPLDLVHRDVSPQNVFVTYDGQVKVLDFGIAKVSTSSTHTATGVLKGKISYMAPEQMSGSPVDRRADVFSVGCMLWAAAAGRKLWKDYSYVQIVRLVLAGEIPSPRRVNPYCPEELERIVMKALAQDPAERYATAFDLQMALESFTENAGLSVKQRDIGRLVTELFQDTRAELQSGIERELAALLATESIAPDRADPSPLSTERPASRSQPPELTLHAAEKPPRRTLLWTGFGIGLLASAAALVFLVRNASGPAPPLTERNVAAPEPRATMPALLPSPVESPVEPATALVRFEVTPPTAAVRLNGALLGEGALERELPRDGTTHELSVEAPGYESATMRFEVTRPRTLTIDLIPRAAAPTKRRLASASARGRAPLVEPTTTLSVAAATPEELVHDIYALGESENTQAIDPAPAAPPNAAPPPAPACQSPFFVDSEGIKRVRTECL